MSVSNATTTDATAIAPARHTSDLDDGFLVEPFHEGFDESSDEL